MKKPLYILDVSGYIFRAYFALPPMSNSQGEVTHALFGFIRSVIKLLKDFAPEHIVAVFDGPDNKKQRQEIYEKYKANRIKRYDDLPEQIEKAREFCALIGIPTTEAPGVEADDAMGSIAIWAAKEDREVFLCTSDKDLCQLVDENIFVLNTWKDNLILDRHKVEEIYGVPPTQIVDLLALVGDSSDNIPGIKGFGPKTSIPLLKEFGSLENLLEHVDQVHGAKKQEMIRDQKENALLSKRLATIYLDIEFDKSPDCFKRKSPDITELKEFYLKMGFTSLIRELEGLFEAAKEEVEYLLVDDEKSLEAFVQQVAQQKEVAFGVESTSHRTREARLVGASFSFALKEVYYLPLNGELGRTKMLEGLQRIFGFKNLSFYGHNAKFDLHILLNEGIHFHHLSFDTILASYLLNSANRQHSLDHLALQYFGKVKTPIKDLVGVGQKEISMDQVSITKVCAYCCEDVDYTFRMKQILSDQIEKRKLASLLYDVELPLTHVLLKMERAGIYLDVDQLKKLSEEVVQEIHTITQEIYQLAGEEFNLSSPKQLGNILFEKMGIKPLKKIATGHSTKADVLEMLSDEHEIAKKILTFRSLEKLRSTYLDVLPGEVNAETGRIHTTFNQFVAATGRLASQDPNLQNIPVRTIQGKRIREAFRAQKTGWSYLAADYSQIELRLLAHLSEEPVLIDAFRAGEDIHTYTASLVLGIPLEKVSPLQRQQAKAINFGIVYGQQSYGLSQELGITPAEAAQFIKAYYERYPKVFEFVENCIKQARKTGKSTTMIGREREIPDISSPHATVRSAAERLAINTPLQGSSADLIKLAMLKIDQELTTKNLKSYLILQIHDELIFEAPDEEVDLLSEIVKNTMEGIFSLKVPLVVDVNIGKNWAEC